MFFSLYFTPPNRDSSYNWIQAFYENQPVPPSLFCSLVESRMSQDAGWAWEWKEIGVWWTLGLEIDLCPGAPEHWDFRYIAR